MIVSVDIHFFASTSSVSADFFPVTFFLPLEGRHLILSGIDAAVIVGDDTIADQFFEVRRVAPALLWKAP